MGIDMTTVVSDLETAINPLLTSGKLTPNEVSQLTGTLQRLIPFTIRWLSGDQTAKVDFAGAWATIDNIALTKDEEVRASLPQIMKDVLNGAISSGVGLLLGAVGL